MSPGDVQGAAAIHDLDLRWGDVLWYGERVYLALQRIGVQAVLSVAMIAQPEGRILRRRSRVFPTPLHLTVDEPGRVQQHVVIGGGFEFILIHGWARCMRRPIIEQSYSNVRTASIELRCNRKVGVLAYRQLRQKGLRISFHGGPLSDARDCNYGSDNGIRGVFIFADQ